MLQDHPHQCAPRTNPLRDPASPHNAPSFSEPSPWHKVLEKLAQPCSCSTEGTKLWLWCHRRARGETCPALAVLGTHGTGTRHSHLPPQPFLSQKSDTSQAHRDGVCRATYANPAGNKFCHSNSQISIAHTGLFPSSPGSPFLQVPKTPFLHVLHTLVPLSPTGTLHGQVSDVYSKSCTRFPHRTSHSSPSPRCLSHRVGSGHSCHQGRFWAHNQVWLRGSDTPGYQQ